MSSSMSLDSAEQKTVQQRDGPEYFCFRGNEELLNNRPKQAIQHYTHVLYELSPGHIGAFLNRCMAYNVYGYPELAAYDAYAAVTLAYQCRELEAPTNGPLIADTVRYAAAEQEAIVGNSLKWKWVESGSTNVGTEWMLEELASLLLIPDLAPESNDPPPPANLVAVPNLYLGATGGEISPAQRSSLTVQPAPQILRMKDMFRILELMGMYRLIGSLRQCGRGALKDALEMVDEMRKKYSLGKVNMQPFYELGDLIFKDVLESYETDPASTAAFMETRITMVNRVIYPWNKYEPEMDKFLQLGDKDDTPPVNPEKTYAMRRKPATAAHATCLRLVATKDIFPGELILTQNAPLQVTTKSPLKKESLTPHCNACAGLMIKSAQARHCPELARFIIPGEESNSASSDSEPIGFTTAASEAIMSLGSQTVSLPPAQIESENTVQGEQSLLDQVQSVQLQDPAGLQASVIHRSSLIPEAGPVSGSLPEPTDMPHGLPDAGPWTETAYGLPDAGPSTEIPHGLPDLGPSNDTEHVSSDGDSKPELPPFDPEVDYQRCRGCGQEASVCSTACADTANEYHSVLCCSGAEEMIRSTYTGRMQRAEREGTNKLDTPAQRLLNESKFNHHERFLHDLLFVRILGLAQSSDMHPLSHPDVRWLGGDLASTAVYAAPYISWFIVCMRI